MSRWILSWSRHLAERRLPSLVRLSDTGSGFHKSDRLHMSSDESNRTSSSLVWQLGESKPKLGTAQHLVTSMSKVASRE